MRHPTFEVHGDSPEHLHRLHFNERTRDSWRHWEPAEVTKMAEVYEVPRAHVPKNMSFRRPCMSTRSSWSNRSAMCRAGCCRGR